MKAAQNTTDLAQKIKSGQFYEDALEWYNSVYIYPVVERTFFLIITTCCVVINFAALISIFNFLPLTIRVPIVIGIDDVGDLYGEVKKLGDVDEEPTHAIGTYLLKQYVGFRENYRYDNLERNDNYMKQTSSPAEVEKYEAGMDLKNPTSPTTRLKQYGAIEVRNIIAMMPPLPAKSSDDKTPQNPKHKGSVSFDTVEVSTLGSKTTKWKADITFLLSEVTFDQKEKKFSTLDFKVEDYIVTPIAEVKPETAPAPVVAKP